MIFQIKQVIKSAYRALGYYPSKFRGINFKHDPYHIGYWREVSSARWEPRTFEILDKYLQPDHVYFDIGAWIGPTVVYAAHKARKVYCVEPDRLSYFYLLWNIHSNKLTNVTAFNFALSTDTELRQVASFGDLGDSTTSLLAKEKPGREFSEMMTLDWDTWLGLVGQHKPGFIKMDIEGAEFSLLPKMEPYLKTHKPILYLSVHPKYMGLEEAREKMQRALDSLGMYQVCMTEDEQRIDPAQLLSDEVLQSFSSFLFMNESDVK